MTRVPPALSLAAMVASSVFAGEALHRAIAIDELPPPTPVNPPPGAQQLGTATALASSKLAAAVGKDPFHPERRRPTVRFRLPGEAERTATDSAPAVAPFKLIGTAAMAEGRGFAMCQYGEEAPKLVRIGERVGDYTLKGVTPGKAVFLTASGKRYEVRVPKAGS